MDVAKRAKYVDVALTEKGCGGYAHGHRGEGVRGIAVISDVQGPDLWI